MRKDKKQTTDPMIEAALADLFGEEIEDEKRERLTKLFEDIIKRATEIGCEVGAKAVAKSIEDERRKARSERFRRMYADTKLLMQHYRSLNSYYANAVWDDEDDDMDEFLDVMELMNSKYSKTVVVESIRKSTEKTRIIMRHVNKMLGIYEKMCKESTRPDDRRHWRVLKAMYLDPDPVSADEVAEMVGVHTRTVYKDIDAAVDDLTVLLFGIDGIEKLGE